MNFLQVKKPKILNILSFILLLFIPATVGAQERLTLSMKFPSDQISLTHSGEAPFPLLPKSITTLKTATKNGGFALLAYIRDSSGNRIGFASELEDLSAELKDGKPADRKTVWTIVLPGRGTIIGYELENISAPVMEAFSYPKLHGKTWTGEITEKNTVGPLEGGYGLIIGGTGEFEGITGHFSEESILREVSIFGELQAEMTLNFFFDNKKHGTSEGK